MHWNISETSLCLDTLEWPDCHSRSYRYYICLSVSTRSSHLNLAIWLYLYIYIYIYIYIKYMHMYIYIYIYTVCRSHENMPLCTSSRVNVNYERIVSQVEAQPPTYTPESQMHISATHKCVQWAKQLAMTHPSKTEWHQPKGPIYCTQQQANTGRKHNTGLLASLHMALVYEYYLSEETWKPVSMHLQQGKWQLRTNCFIGRCPAASMGSLYLTICKYFWVQNSTPVFLYMSTKCLKGNL